MSHSVRPKKADDLAAKNQVLTERMPLWQVIEGCLVGISANQEFVKKRVSFELDLNSSSILVDKHSVGSLLSDVLENALKNTPEDGRIGISCKNSSDFFQLHISDGGSGTSIDTIKGLPAPIASKHIQAEQREQ